MIAGRQQSWHLCFKAQPCCGVQLGTSPTSSVGRACCGMPAQDCRSHSAATRGPRLCASKTSWLPAALPAGAAAAALVPGWMGSGGGWRCAGGFGRVQLPLERGSWASARQAAGLSSMHEASTSSLHGVLLQLLLLHGLAPQELVPRLMLGLARRLAVRGMADVRACAAERSPGGSRLSRRPSASSG